jgi:hypothetical protein
MDSFIPNIPTAAPPLTEVALCTWLGVAAPGDRITYHRGFLAREVSPLTKLRPEPERVALMRLASRAWKLADVGLAHLLQRRHGDEDYEYLIVARPRPRNPHQQALRLLLKEAA